MKCYNNVPKRGDSMTIAEADRFYEQDQKEYDVKNNKALLCWLKEKKRYGYKSFMEIDDLQELIDNVVRWYELKYPERELQTKEGVIFTNFRDIQSLSDVMDSRQLLYRLPHKQICLLESGYRARGGGANNTIFMSVKRKEYDVNKDPAQKNRNVKINYLKKLKRWERM